MPNSVSKAHARHANAVSQWFAGWFPLSARRGRANRAYRTSTRRALTAAVERLEDRQLLASTLLTNGSGVGSVHVTVDAYGGFGLNAPPANDAVFFPLASPAPGGTTSASAVYFDPANAFLAEAPLGGPGLPGVPFTATAPTTATSQFDLNGFHFVLTQTLNPITPSGSSTLVQRYTITNNNPSLQSFPLVRALESNMAFSGPPSSDWGAASSDGRTLYSFDVNPANTATSSPFIAITSLGGSSFSGFTVQPANYFNNIVQNFRIPAQDQNQVFGDITGDRFSDVAYPVTLAQQDLMVMPPNSTLTYETRTIFGAGAPTTVFGAGQLQFANAVFSQAENGGPATITVTRTGGALGQVTVNYSTAPGGTATPGTDFTPAAGSLIFATGQTIATFTVPVIDNNVSQGNKTVNLVLTNPTGGAVLGQDTATLTIIDDETPGQFQFQNPTLSVNENAGIVTLTVTRVGGGFGTASVNYDTINGDAIAGQDYVTTSGVLNFLNGETSKTIDVPIIDDLLVENDEFFGVTLSNPSAGATLGAPSQINANITIVDDDSGFEFSAPFYDVREDAANAVVTVNRVGKTDFAASVSYSTTNGSATAPDDYLATAGVLTFAPGQDSAIITVPIVQDLLAEPTETVNLAMFGNSTGTSLRTPLAVINIIDVDKRPFQADVSKMAFLGGVNNTSGITIGFDEPLNPGTVVVPSFSLWSQGSITRFGTGPDKPLTINSVAYDPANQTVTLFPTKPLKMNKIYRVAVAGINGITDLEGNPIDGNRDGIGGDSYNAYFGRGTSLAYLDRNGDEVDLSLTGGGTMDLIRDFDGEAHDLRLSGTRSNRSTLSGKVKPRLPHADGLTSLQNLTGAVNVRNRLSTPPFSITTITG